MSEIADEVKRLSERLWRMTARGGDYISEVPMRIHSRETDPGGSPEFHPAFISYLVAAGVCVCEPEWPDGTPRAHACDRRFEGTAKVREPRHETHPRRLKRAFRQLRLLAPYDEYHLTFLVVCRSQPFPQALDQVNAARLARGELPLSHQEAAIMLVAGVDLAQSCW